MKLRRWSTVLVLVAAAVPPVALADSAGDQQYVDPLASATTPASHPARARHHVSGQVPVAPPSAAASPDPATVATATPAASTTTATATASDPSAGSKSLPYTGVNLPLLAACGALLMFSGVILRRRVTRTR